MQTRIDGVATKRRFSLTLVSLAVWLLAAAPVGAAAPDREPITNVAFVSSGCGFEVDITIPVQNEFATAFFDQDGDLTKLIVTGRLVFTFTNPANGISITANVSGPGIFDFVKGTAYAFGSGGGPSPSGLILGHGRLNLSTFEINGNTVNLCPMLSGS
jgi:hypothetical protein